MDTYDEYEYQGIKIYIDKSVKISETLQIKVKIKIPLFKPAFTVKGVF